jgi:hypothetical protein
MDLEFDPDGMAEFLTTDYCGDNDEYQEYENKKRSRRKKIKDAPKTRLQQPYGCHCSGSYQR